MARIRFELTRFFIPTDAVELFELVLKLKRVKSLCAQKQIPQSRWN
jgi:hypothetical protein